MQDAIQLHINQQEVYFWLLFVIELHARLLRSARLELTHASLSVATCFPVKPISGPSTCLWHRRDSGQESLVLWRSCKISWEQTSNWACTKIRILRFLSDPLANKLLCSHAWDSCGWRNVQCVLSVHVCTSIPPFRAKYPRKGWEGFSSNFKSK